MDSSNPTQLPASFFDAGKNVGDNIDHFFKIREDQTRLAVIDFIELYRKGACGIVVKFKDTTRLDSCHYEFVFVSAEFSCKAGGNNLSRTTYDNHALNDYSVSSNSGGNNDSVNIFSTEMIKSPESMIPSFVWLERAKKRFDLMRDINTISFDDILKMSRIAGEREIRFSGIGFPGDNGDGVCSLIENSSETPHDIVDTIGPIRGGNMLRKSDFMDFLSCIRIIVNDLGTTCFFEETKNVNFELGELSFTPI